MNGTRLTKLQLQQRAIACIALLAMSCLFQVLELRTISIIASLDLAGMCCEHVATPLTQRLTEIKGVIHAEPRFDEDRIRIQTVASRPPSPKAIWEAVEQSAARPIRLTFNGQTYLAKPRF